MTAELHGPELLRAAINKILANPEQWDQTNWHCGTKHCFGGWCQVLSGRNEIGGQRVISDLAEELGPLGRDADWLCAGMRSLSELHFYVKELIAGNKEPLTTIYNRDGCYDRAGYNRAGYDRYGYDRYGYDRAGYDRYGYDRDGYDRAGYDRDGYDRDGYNRAGYNRAGYNRDGYNRDGYNRDGYNRDGSRLQPL